jgi:hypothetical protein
LFFEAIQKFRPQVVDDLFLTAFLCFTSFIARRFNAHLSDAWLRASASLPEVIRHVRSIPEIETRVIIDWQKLQRMRGSKELCGQLRLWAQFQNLDVDWCYDHAIRALRAWLYDERILWTGLVPQIPEVSGDAEGWKIGWRQAVDELKLDLFLSRRELALEVFGECGPPPFSCEIGDLLFFKFNGDPPGWNYLQEGKEEWRASVEREFWRLIANLHNTNKSVPPAGLTQLRKKIAEYLLEQDEKKQIAIKKHHLVKVSPCPADHLNWLVHYQINPGMTSREIAELAGKKGGTISKYVEVAAKKIGLPLRNPKLFAGRPIGSTGTSTRRNAYRENPTKKYPTNDTKD